MSSTNPFSGGWGNSSLSRTLARRSPFGIAHGVVPLAASTSNNPTGSSTIPVNGPGDDTLTDGKRQTLFGPMIGGDEGDDFEDTDAGSRASGGSKETVSVETVKGWIERSKSGENPHPTTTLQSHVNLKRPTLSFAALPLSTSSSDNLYTLKLTYDCATPTLQLSLRLVMPSPTAANPNGTTAETLWAGLLPGGFGKHWTLPADVQFDLGLVERGLDNAKLDQESIKGDGKRMSSYSGASALEPLPSAQYPFRNRGGLLGRLTRSNVPEDVEAQNNVAMQNISLDGKAKDEAVQGAASEGPRQMVRLVIRLEARGENGAPLSNLNAQQTHVELIRSTGGVSTPSNGEESSEISPAPFDPEGATATFVLGGDDTPPISRAPRRTVWTGKVIRREALIGSHIFHLREIYGLTSSAANTTTTDANPTATYPPSAETHNDPYASTPNECIVCLVSPRDVVLLPCRHLVVCKECAVGMVEFGAGGKVNRREGDGELSGGPSETTPTTAGEPSTANGETAEGGAHATPVAAVTPATTQPTRRKKKAKGWFCPVCRQPYTAMLRIALPSTKPGLEMSVPVHAHHYGATASTQSLPAGGDATDAPTHPQDLPDRAPSPVPTLPGRAASVLYPNSDLEDEDDDDAEEEERRRIRINQREEEEEAQRPQFVLGPEVDAGADEERRRNVEGRV